MTALVHELQFHYLNAMIYLFKNFIWRNIKQLFHERALAITNLISNKREWNNYFIKNASKIYQIRLN